MGKTAFIFPGQGSQYVGMSKEFYDNYDVARQVFEKASKETGLDIADLVFNENDRLNQTEYTQIAMFVAEMAILSVLKADGYKADICAGLSLGEYGSLALSEVLPLEDLFVLVRNRGIFMQNAYPTGGAMCAVLGMDTETIEKICDETDGCVLVANYNCPGQIVITGEEGAVTKASEALKDAGAKRCIMLKVSGPFHSPLLDDARVKLEELMNNMEFKDPVIPYYSNVNATYVDTKDGIRKMLGKQMVSSVMWQQSVEKMIKDGVDTFVEIGPGKTLSGFIGRIDKSVRVFNIDKLADYEKFKAEF